MSYGIYLNQIPGLIYTTGNDTIAFQYAKEGRVYTVQTGHVSLEQLETITSWNNVHWLYMGVSPEGILVFQYNGTAPDSLVDVEPMAHTLYPESFMWITPKGFPRPQPTLWAPLRKPATCEL